MYVITGATGNTGKPITLALLEAGKKVRIISRDAEKARELTDKGAELFVGETNNVELLKKAFEGANAVYAMIPMSWISKDYTAHQVEHARAIAEAVEYCGVKHVVSLSSQGAHLESGSGVVLGLHKMEKIFDDVEGLHALHLRPSYFMENTLGMVDLIKQAGIMGSPLKGDNSLPVIATKDIAEYAIKRLLALDFEGKSYQDLLGARDVTYNEMAKVYGSAIGKPDLQYVEFSYEDFKKSMVEQMGASANVADNFNDFIKSVNKGKVDDGVRNTESTTPTTIEEFAHTFKYVFEMKKTTVIFSHPYFSQSNSNIIVTEAIKKLDQVNYRHIDALYPDGKIDIEAEQKVLLESDLIIFQFPLFWYTIPASLKNWIDCVFNYGFAFGSEGDKLKGKDLLVAATIGGPEESYSAGGYNKFTIDALLLHLKATANLTGLNYLQPINTHGMIFIPDVYNTLEGVQEKAKEHAERLVEFIQNYK